MNFYEIKNKKSEVYPAILSESFLDITKRKRLRRIVFYILTLSFLFMLIGSISGGNAIMVAISENIFVFRSIFVMFFVLWAFFYLLEVMYLSYYFKESDIDFEVLKIAHNSDNKDLTLAFIESDLGQYALARLGIGKNETKQFLENRKDKVDAFEFEVVDKDGKFTIAEFGFTLLHFDSDFNKLLKSKGVSAKDFKDTLDWVSRIQKRIREEERWWTKDKLYKIPSIGKNWSFGQIYYLERFGHSVYADNSYIHLGDKARLLKEEIKVLESVLLKDRGSNAILISRESYLGREVIASLAQSILNGRVDSRLENKRIYMLDANMLLSVFEKRAEFEAMFSRVLVQAANAGNVILAITEFSDFIENARGLGVDVKDLLSEILTTSNLQVVALSNARGFHQSIETDLDLMRHFEKIVLEDLDTKTAIELVEDEAMVIEAKDNLFFTYQALKKVVESADRYFGEGSLSDKAIDVLTEVSAIASVQKQKLITDADVLDVVEQKTGVALGNLTRGEKRKLNEIEEKLKERVIGQDRAVATISSAMKRARTGVANPKRPLGSFLFIGPTGVGKTETSKALAQVLFGEDEDMIRIDMSEYSGFGAVDKLIGTAEGNPGILSSRVREKQYGVLLLDEFEKADSSISDMFLQVLDEGFFSDGIGERVNARNLVIIATSNAGSNLIYEAQKAGVDLKSQKQQIIDQLISSKIFRPELLNRFDDIVLFNPLNDKTLESIVAIAIEKLNSRLEDKGIDVEIDDVLRKYLVHVGQNKKFGAREINRVIQKEIETQIAEGLLDGIIEKGDTITFVETNKGIEVKRMM
jgi:ATP-dependent Clp protease ATP-binding subunit ClpC